MMNLSGIELYYTPPQNIAGDIAIITGDEFNHITRVMRHSVNDEIYFTNGEGKIFLSVIVETKKDKLAVKILNSHSYENKLKNIFFCIPKIKSTDRFEFALEKCVELGITNFIIFESKRSYKKGEKEERWKRILLAAMKQSLLSYMPVINSINSLQEIMEYPGEKIVLEQNADKHLNSIKPAKNTKYYFIFGPEGGLTNDELHLAGKENHYSITSNRLRTETAVVTCAAIINSLS